MSGLAVIDAVIEDEAFFKKAGPWLEALPPDQQAVDRLVAAPKKGTGCDHSALAAQHCTRNTIITFLKLTTL